MVVISSLLLGVLYIAGILLYVRRRLRSNYQSPAISSAVSEEHVVKNNPLLVHCHDTMVYLNESSPSIEESDAVSSAQEENNQMVGSVKTSAMVHGSMECIPEDTVEQGNDANECIPEQNISIVDTLEVRDEKSLPLGVANVRRKLYFNPAYFEPELLVAPPPGAIEFLTKIREVITFAKSKIEAKKYLPSLMSIPEECTISKKFHDTLNFNTLTSSSDTETIYGINTKFTVRKWLETMPYTKMKYQDYTMKNNIKIYEEKLPNDELQLEIIDNFNDINTMNNNNNDETHYEIIEQNNKNNIFSDSEIKLNENDYELISINKQSNDFNSLPDLTNINFINNNDFIDSKNGCLSITLENDIIIDKENDSDGIEPDTLDRKPNKFRINDDIVIKRSLTHDDIYFDSLERPVITLKSNNNNNNNNNNNGKRKLQNRAFNSLREIFEAKYKQYQCKHKIINEKILKPEERQAKRQREPQPNLSIKPPCLHENFKKINNKKTQSRPEDLGYLSTESNESKIYETQSDTDDSYYDGASESGAESTATDSFLFGKIRKCTHNINNNNNNKNDNNNDNTSVPQNSENDSNVSLITVISNDNDDKISLH
ncbi:hypothetical protein O3M35_003826 [Rhynocoris fuscipes]|uniref:Uncharacterized protein n=1 Tax=Rhynocoris fuscipes TaxID=488301 RepID=A0AAW1CM73_9HEMI